MKPEGCTVTEKEPPLGNVFGSLKKKGYFMPTERLYYQDAYQKEFDGTVLECRRSQKGWEVRLDRTAFYPEGGGQPCDIGTLDQIPVEDVQEKDGEIWHFVSEPVESGTPVHGKICWERRFDLMQQHSGEHIVSGLIHEKYGCDNIGFHMGPELITINFNGEIPPEGLEEIEQRANRYVWENRPTEISWPSAAQLEKIPYRSKKELEGDVRIVTYPGADICACCGIHVAHSGEIGQIMLVSSQRAKGGTQVEMLCGRRALRFSNEMKTQNRKISVLLSAKLKETAQAVEKLNQEYQQTKFRLVGMELERFASIAENLRGKGDQLIFQEDLAPDSVRKLAAGVMETCKGRCAVFSGKDGEGYRYAVGLENGDLREWTRRMNQALQGRGGGKPFFVQGSVQATREEIEAFFREN